MFYYFRRRKVEKAGDAAMDAVIATAKKAVEKAAYAAAVAECEARNALPGTAEMVMRTVLDNAKLSEAEIIKRKESSAGKIVYALYDNNAHVAYAAAMKVFYHATMAAMDEAGDAFDAAYAASMRETGYWPELLEQKYNRLTRLFSQNRPTGSSRTK